MAAKRAASELLTPSGIREEAMMTTTNSFPRAPVRCVVCQKEIRAAESRLDVHWRGGHYVVCCPSCARQFGTSPATYVPAP
jgi:YHS domain-containing protein